jgi:hypothetical protein
MAASSAQFTAWDGVVDETRAVTDVCVAVEWDPVARKGGVASFFGAIRENQLLPIPCKFTLKWEV